MAHRHRFALAPASVLLALALVVEIGHLVNSGAWWWGALLPLAVGVPVALVRSRGEDRLFTGVVALGAGGWGGAAWAFGPLAPPLAGVLVAGAVVVSGPWWRYASARGRIEVIGGTWWRLWEWGRWTWTLRSAGALRAASADWPRVAADAGVPSRVVRLTADEWCYTLHLELASGVEHERLLAARGRIESALDALRGKVSIEPEARARRAVLRWERPGVVRPALEWKGPSGQGFHDPLVIAEHEDRTPLEIVYAPGQSAHTLIAGDSGSGKTALMRLLVSEWAWRPDTLLWAFDVPKKGAGFGPLADALSRLVRESDEVVPSLEALVRIVASRGRWLGERRLEFWPTSPTHPQVVVLVDEVAELVKVRGAVSLLLTIARLGRQMGVALVLATQRPAGEALGDSTELRALMRTRIGLYVNERKDGALVFGDDTASRGWRPDLLPGPGWLLVRSPGHPVPRQAQFRFVAFDDLAEREVPVQPELDAVSAAAEAGGGPGLVVLPGAEPVPARPAYAGDETAERLALLEAALRELGPTASVRRLAERAFADVNTKTWIADRGLPALVAAGRVVGEPGNWRVVDGGVGAGGNTAQGGGEQ